MKNPNSKMFGRKNDLNPFDDETGIEFLTTKNDSSLFLFGSHNKKRPHNIVMVSTHQHVLRNLLHITLLQQQQLLTSSWLAHCMLLTAGTDV
jgi:ribosome production factor 2